MSGNEVVEIPRKIYTLWLQGSDQAPPVPDLCFQRWRSLNPGYELTVLEKKDLDLIKHHIPIDLEAIPVQALSDILRTKLLLDQGGIWVDASLFPVRPLSSWLSPVTSAGFFAFANPGPDRPIASWFLAATPGHQMIAKWWNEVLRYWSKHRTLLMDPRNGNPVPADPVGEVAPEYAATSGSYPYFWFHYLFRYLLGSDEDFSAAWDACPKVSANDPHALQAAFRRSGHAAIGGLRDFAAMAPVQKLDWRQDYPMTDLVGMELD